VNSKKINDAAGGRCARARETLTRARRFGTFNHAARSHTFDLKLTCYTCAATQSLCVLIAWGEPSFLIKLGSNDTLTQSWKLLKKLLVYQIELTIIMQKLTRENY
jgi:hypothetical protein